MTMLGRLATFLAGLLGGGLGLLAILPLGLVVVEWVVFPTALAVGALLAALAAGWAGTWTAGDGTRTRLAAVVAVAGAAGPALALAVLGSAALRGALLAPVIGVAGGASLTLALLALAAAGVPALVALARLAGLTDA
jgi:hypothetical protein